MTTTTPRTAEYVRSTKRATRGRRRVLPALLTATALVAGALAVFPHAQAQRTARKVSGVVVEAATQQPVPDARVRYEETGQPPRTTVTDTKGSFEFPAGRLGEV